MKCIYTDANGNDHDATVLEGEPPTDPAKPVPGKVVYLEVPSLHGDPTKHDQAVFKTYAPDQSTAIPRLSPVTLSVHGPVWSGSKPGISRKRLAWNRRSRICGCTAGSGDRWWN